jgi:hypothetical protein
MSDHDHRHHSCGAAMGGRTENEEMEGTLPPPNVGGGWLDEEEVEEVVVCCG